MFLEDFSMNNLNFTNLLPVCYQSVTNLLPIIYFFSVMGPGLSILNAKLPNVHLCPKLITLNAKSWLDVVPIMVPWSITYVILGTKGLGYQFCCANLTVPGPARYHLVVDSNAMISPKLIMDTWWIQIANISMVMKAVLNVIKVRFWLFWLLLGCFGYFWAVLATFG